MMKRNYKKHIWQIVQIFDTDGTYVPENAIIEGDSREFHYSTTVISCNDTNKVIQRNKWKSKVMDDLLKLSDIKEISYRCYFMSSNLDHALYNLQNLTDEEKKTYSNEFYEIFEGRERLFIDFLTSDVVNGCPDSFPSSWKYIKENLHSLERHTNRHSRRADSHVHAAAVPVCQSERRVKRLTFNLNICRCLLNLLRRLLREPEL